MKLLKKTSTLLFSLVLVLALFLSSCSAKYEILKDSAGSTQNKDAGVKLALDPYKNVEPASQAESAPVQETNTEELIKSEMNDFATKLEPYLQPDSPYFISDEVKQYLQEYLLKPTGFMEPIAVKDWERIVRSLFFLGKGDDSWFKMYITDFTSDEKIERQYAVSGLMKLLSLRYSLSLGGDFENLKKSDEISDIELLKDTHQILVRQAYCLGLTDVTVQNGKNFRPDNYLTRGEAISMFYRILDKLGMPYLGEVSDAPVSDEAINTPKAKSADKVNALTIEDIRQEYQAYIDTLKKSDSPESQKKLSQLTQCETILRIYFPEGDIIAQSMTLDQWKQILTEVFSLEPEKTDSYLSYETGSILPYDVAAISIFKLSYLFGGYDARDASSDELESARAAIPQFDTARDISKFAQMYAAGLLDGLYQMPGFTPQRPVSKVEALLIIKRMIEDMGAN